MADDFVAKAEIDILAPIEKVWDALVNPDTIKRYMFGTTVVSDWVEGSQIVWKGEWKGKEYEDKGRILKLEPERIMEYSHFSPLAGLPDAPENYHTVKVELLGDGTHTHVTLTQTNNSTKEAQEHSEQNWNAMLESMKKIVEDSTS